MRLGLISDIHGRFDALELAWTKLQRECDHILCMGDIVNGGGDADACIRFVREQQLPTVRGNHDDAWLMMCGIAEMGSANFKYMRELPALLQQHGIVMVHDDPVMATADPEAWRKSQGYILRQEQADMAFEKADIFRTGPQVVLIGHTHVPAVFTTAGEVKLRPGEPSTLPANVACIINPGAVGGRARSAWGNTCAILDTEKNTFTVFQLAVTKLANPWDDFFDKIVSY